MLGGFKALLHSEKALVGGLLSIASTVLVLTGHMTIESWQSFNEVLFGFYVGGKTVQGAVSMWAKTKAKPES